MYYFYGVKWPVESLQQLLHIFSIHFAICRMKKTFGEFRNNSTFMASLSQNCLLVINKPIFLILHCSLYISIY